MDWQLSDLIVYQFHWKRLINKDECDGRTCIFILCLTSTHLNLETVFKRRILVLRTATSSHLQLRFRYLVKFDAVLRFSLSTTCGIAVFVPPLRPPPFTKRSSELKFGGIFFKHYWLSLLSQKVRCLLSSSVRSLLWRSSHWPSCFAERSRSVFAFFTYHERHIWHMKYERVFMLFVCFSFISEVVTKEPGVA